MIAADLLEYQNHHYLLVVDYFSKWPEVIKLDNLSSKTTIACLKDLFQDMDSLTKSFPTMDPGFHPWSSKCSQLRLDSTCHKQSALCPIQRTGRKNGTDSEKAYHEVYRLIQSSIGLPKYTS